MTNLNLELLISSRDAQLRKDFIDGICQNLTFLLLVYCPKIAF